MNPPLAIDLFCGLGGWAEGFLAEGYRVVGFDIERHDYSTGGYPGQLVLQDVLTLDGAQFRAASCIVASPPCQEYSYMAMPWSRAKKIAAEYRDGTRNTADLKRLFDACFRIQREASAAAGRYVPLVVENVKGAQPWVGSARWHYGSFYLWGDVPALMPHTFSAMKTVGHVNKRDGHTHTRHLTNQRESDQIKNNGGSWFNVAHNTDTISPGRLYGKHSESRRAASAQIAKIHFPLAQHIARVYYPHCAQRHEETVALASNFT